MNFLLITAGLPGRSYHGGAITCWSIIKAMIKRRHKVSVLSLFDDNPRTNPYIESRENEPQTLSHMGVDLHFIEYDQEALYNASSETTSTMIHFFPWAILQGEVQKKIDEIKPDAIFCYHFDALSATYITETAPIMAGVGDLWHMPAWYRWRMSRPSLKKIIKEARWQLFFARRATEFMCEMLRRCSKKGVFAAHYAAWFRQKKGLSDTLYLQTPVYDPAGGEWETLRREYLNNGKIPIILMIGELVSTVTKSGFEVLVKDILPILEREYGREGFEIHLVGGHALPDRFRILKEKPYVKIKGRVAPADKEFLNSTILLVSNSIPLGIRVRILNGFSCGCCVVTHKANLSGIPEIRHNENALVASSGKKLAHEIIRALSDADLRRQLQRNARATYERYFALDTAGSKIADRIEEMVSSN